MGSSRVEVSEPLLLAATVMMHVLPIAFQPPPPPPPSSSLSLRPAFTICFGSPPFCPLIFFSPSSCVLCTVHPPSSFVCLGAAPSIVPPCASHFRFGVALWPRALCPPPMSLLLMPPPQKKPTLTGTPNLLVLPLTALPLSFFLEGRGGVANNCCQQAPHKIPAWLLLWGSQ